MKKLVSNLKNRVITISHSIARETMMQLGFQWILNHMKGLGNLIIRHLNPSIVPSRVNSSLVVNRRIGMKGVGLIVFLFAVLSPLTLKGQGFAVMNDLPVKTNDQVMLSDENSVISGRNDIGEYSYLKPIRWADKFDILSRKVSAKRLTILDSKVEDKKKKESFFTRQRIIYISVGAVATGAYFALRSGDDPSVTWPVPPGRPTPQ